MSDARVTSEEQPPVALVTGAGTGIGRAICVLLAREGFHIVMVGRTQRTLTETVDAIVADGLSHSALLVVVADLSDPSQARSAADRAIEKWGRLDVLINNAGAVEAVPIEETTQELLDRMFAVNAFGPAHLIARAWPVFLPQGRGCVVNVSTMSTIDPFPGLSAYAASKAALESLTRSINNEGRIHGIRAFTVAPGAVETAMLRRLIPENDLPRERTLDPMDVARVVVDCALGRRDVDIGRIIRLPSA